MNSLRFALAAVAAALVATPAAAQGVCDFDTKNASQLGAVMELVTRHDLAADDAERLKFVRDLVKALTDNPGRFRNEPARNFVLGTVYVRWLLDQHGNPAVSAKRGEVGLRERADDDFFFPAAFDSAMAVVEREKPLCADSALKYRNAAFVRLLNAGITNLNAKSYDSAIDYANHALRVGPRVPQASMAYQVLTQASQAKGDLAGAITGLTRLLETMPKDSASTPARLTASFNLAVFTRDQALKQDGDARTAGLRRAAELFKTVADLAPDGPNAAAARTAAARALRDAGEGSAVADLQGEMLGNPSKFTALQLFEAAVLAANAQRNDDAARLYEAGLQVNPWYRDALFNLANVYFAQHQPDKMAPLVAKLRGIDPMNGDVMKLAGAVWQERGRQATDARARQLAQDSVNAYVDRAAKLPARVVVSQFRVSRDTVTISGSVENLLAAAANLTISFELLDKTGAVVGTVALSAGQLAPKVPKNFTAEAAGASPVAWRYTVR